MKTVEKKVFPEYFAAILAGKKSYELRLNDFDIAEGDTLLLKEWTGSEYTGREIAKRVTYVGKFDINKLFWSKEEIEKYGLQRISLA